MLYAVKSASVPAQAGPGAGLTRDEMLTAKDQLKSTGLRLCQTNLPTLKNIESTFSP